MDLTQLEARLRSFDLLERNLAIDAAVGELRRCYGALEELIHAIDVHLEGNEEADLPLVPQE